MILYYSGLPLFPAAKFKFFSSCEIQILFQDIPQSSFTLSRTYWSNINANIRTLTSMEYYASPI